MQIFFQSDEDKGNFAKLIEVIKESKKGKTLGVFSKENYPGAFMDAWRAALKSESFDTVKYLNIFLLIYKFYLFLKKNWYFIYIYF